MRSSALILFLFLSLSLFAQKDTTLTLHESESLFLKNNLGLLAAQFNVDAARAAIIKARTWENPNFTVTMNA